MNGIGLGLVALGAGALYGAVGGGAYFAMAAMGGLGALLAARLIGTTATWRRRQRVIEDGRARRSPFRPGPAL